MKQIESAPRAVFSEISNGKSTSSTVEFTSLSYLADTELLATTKMLVAEERSATTNVLHAVNEIELRRLHSLLGFYSLHEFMVKHLGYSDSGAHRRIAAARLLRAMPKTVGVALKTGAVNLTTLAAAQDFFVAEKRDFKREYSFVQKQEVLSAVALKSRRQCEEIFQKLSPDRAAAPRQEKVRVIQKTAMIKADFDQKIDSITQSAVTEPHLEVTLTIRPEFQKKLTRIKELLSHHPGSAKTYADLFELMADQLLKKLDPLLKPSRNSPMQTPTAEFGDPASPGKLRVSPNGPTQNAHSSQNNAMTDRNKNLEVHTVFHQPQNPKPKPSPNPKPSRYIPGAVKSAVHERDGGQCSYVNPISNVRCNARRFLHIDHIQPLALGGQTTAANCRLLCAQHNTLAAIHRLGPEIMGQYVILL